MLYPTGPCRTRSSIFMLSISNMSCSRPFSRSWLPPSFSAERALPKASSSSANIKKHFGNHYLGTLGRDPK